MRSFFATLRSLVLPAGAGPGSPAIIIGPAIPADLQAYYGGTIVACIIYRFSATAYGYFAVTAATVVQGSSANGTVRELNRWITFGGSAEAFVTYGVLNPVIFRIDSPSSGSVVSLGSAAAGNKLPFSVNGHLVSGARVDTFRVNAPAGNTNSTVFVDYPGPVDITLDKGLGGTLTDVLIEVKGTCFSTVAGDGVEFAVNNAGTDYQLSAALRFANTNFNAHAQFGGGTRVHNLAAGSQTFRLRWRTQNGRDATVNNDDTLTFSAIEVSAV